MYVYINAITSLTALISMKLICVNGSGSSYCPDTFASKAADKC